MQLSQNDEYLIQRIVDADNREHELFNIIQEFGLAPADVAKIQDELAKQGITRREHDKKSHTEASPWKGSISPSMEMT